MYDASTLLFCPQTFGFFKFRFMQVDWLCEIQGTVHKTNKITVCFLVVCSMVQFNRRSVILHISLGVGAL
jgi:hypothetical protein